MAIRGGVDISMIGDKKLERRLRKLPEKVQKKVVRPALRAAARPVLNRAKQYAPVDRGELKASLKIRAIKQRRGKFGVKVQTGTREELGIDPASKWYYPAIVEYGHRGAPPHPYIRSATDDERPNALRILGIEIGQGIERVAREGR